ncbi:MAG TPA: T3SS effector HopA1 family protein [Roseiflexaceae bacterium]|nr:T3SS effector HopA1 family protein [Roseiflexaceae bacterium]
MMKHNHLQDLKQLLGAIAIVSPTAFSLAGQVFHCQESAEGTAGQAQQPLVAQLQQALYAHSYVQRFNGRIHTLALATGPDENLVQSLSQANTSRERWERDWQIAQIAASGQIVAHKRSATRTLWPGEFIAHDGPGVPARVGAQISIYAPRESTAMQPGFYFAFGEAPAEPHDLYDSVRFYWNISDGGAAELIGALTRLLNRFLVPFRLKCCNSRPLFYRLDSAVLYVPKRFCRITAELLVEIYPRLRSELGGATPLFTRRLAPGLAFAEEPGTGESFGMFCCRVVAEAVWSSAAQGGQARLEVVAERFRSYDIDIARPYLRSGSVNRYEFPAYA